MTKTTTTTTTVIGNTVEAKTDTKQPATINERKNKAKKQATDTTVKAYMPVVTQALGRTLHQLEKMSVLVTIPGNITNAKQLIVEFEEGTWNHVNKYG
jgi:hypothetical protein